MKSALALIIGDMIYTSVAYSADPTTITGSVTRVRDRDTIIVGPIPIRLNGVAAPERQDALGKEATAFMRKLASGKTVRCRLNGQRTHDRFVGICYLRGTEIGETIIEVVLARSCPHYPGGRDRANEAAAEANGEDISKSYVLPSYCRLRR